MVNIQYISDSEGMPTGVFIPLNDWNRIKEKYGDIEDELIDLPQWQKDELDRRLEEHRKDPGQVLDFDTTMDDIDSEL